MNQNSLAAALQGISAVDVGVILLIIIFALRCAFRGFVREIMVVAGLLVGVLAGFLFSGLLAPVFQQWIGPSPWNTILAFGVIFLVASLLMLFVRNALESVVENLQLENMDHFFGFLLGIVEGVLVVFLLLFLLSLQQVIPLDKELRSSIAFNLMSPLFGAANELLSKAPAALQSVPLPTTLPSIGK